MRAILIIAVLLCVGATLRFQRTVIQVSGRALSQTSWRVLLPGQSGKITIQQDGKLKADQYAVYGLVWVGGFFHEQETVVIRCKL